MDFTVLNLKKIYKLYLQNLNCTIVCTTVFKRPVILYQSKVVFRTQPKKTKMQEWHAVFESRKLELGKFNWANSFSSLSKIS